MSSGASPGAILEEWTLDELRDAMEYERQYGVIGPERLDYLAAQISMYLARTASKKAPKSLDEYLLKNEDMIIDFVQRGGLVEGAEFTEAAPAVERLAEKAGKRGIYM